MHSYPGAHPKHAITSVALFSNQHKGAQGRTADTVVNLRNVVDHASLRLAFDIVVASTAAGVLHQQHTTLCGAHHDADIVPRSRSALILQLHSQLRSCLTALGIRHCGCLDSCSCASSTAHYFVRGCHSYGVPSPTLSFQEFGGSSTERHTWPPHLRCPQPDALFTRGRRLFSTERHTWLPQLRCSQPDALFTRGRRLFSSERHTWLPQLRCPKPDALFPRGRRLLRASHPATAI